MPARLETTNVDKVQKEMNRVADNIWNITAGPSMSPMVRFRADFQSSNWASSNPADADGSERALDGDSLSLYYRSLCTETFLSQRPRPDKIYASMPGGGFAGTQSVDQRRLSHAGAV